MILRLHSVGEDKLIVERGASISNLSIIRISMIRFDLIRLDSSPYFNSILSFNFEKYLSNGLESLIYIVHDNVCTDI